MKVPPNLEKNLGDLSKLSKATTQQLPDIYGRYLMVSLYCWMAVFRGLCLIAGCPSGFWWTSVLQIAFRFNLDRLKKMLDDFNRFQMIWLKTHFSRGSHVFPHSASISHKSPALGCAGGRELLVHAGLHPAHVGHPTCTFGGDAQHCGGWLQVLVRGTGAAKGMAFGTGQPSTSSGSGG